MALLDLPLLLTCCLRCVCGGGFLLSSELLSLSPFPSASPPSPSSDLSGVLSRRDSVLLVGLASLLALSMLCLLGLPCLPRLKFSDLATESTPISSASGYSATLPVPGDDIVLKFVSFCCCDDVSLSDCSLCSSDRVVSFSFVVVVVVLVVVVVVAWVGTSAEFLLFRTNPLLVGFVEKSGLVEGDSF